MNIITVLQRLVIFTIVSIVWCFLNLDVKALIEFSIIALISILISDTIEMKYLNKRK